MESEKSELESKLDEHTRKLRYKLGLCSTQEMKDMTAEQLSEYLRNNEKTKRMFLDWRDGMLAIHSKIVSHKNEYKHEGCCMHLIERILLDYGFIDASESESDKGWNGLGPFSFLGK